MKCKLDIRVLNKQTKQLKMPAPNWRSRCATLIFV